MKGAVGMQIFVGCNSITQVGIIRESPFDTESATKAAHAFSPSIAMCMGLWSNSVSAAAQKRVLLCRRRLTWQIARSRLFVNGRPIVAAAWRAMRRTTRVLLHCPRLMAASAPNYKRRPPTHLFDGQPIPSKMHCCNFHANFRQRGW